MDTSQTSCHLIIKSENTLGFPLNWKIHIKTNDICMILNSNTCSFISYLISYTTGSEIKRKYSVTDENGRQVISLEAEKWPWYLSEQTMFMFSFPYSAH